MNPRTLLLFFVAAAIIAGLVLFPKGEKQVSMFPDPEALHLMQLDREFDADVAERGLDAWVERFAANGSMIGPGQSITGPDSVRAAMRPAFDNPDWSLRWEPDRGEMMIPGHLGYTSGRFERKTRAADGTLNVQHGRYVTVWQKQPDGSWKIVMDTGEADPPPTASSGS